MMAGVKERGADDGWWLNALAMELNHVRGEASTGAAVDVFKCFDQVRRDLLYEMAYRAGMPKRVLHAYRSFQEALVTRNGMGGGSAASTGEPAASRRGARSA